MIFNQTLVKFSILQIFISVTYTNRHYCEATVPPDVKIKTDKLVSYLLSKNDMLSPPSEAIALNESTANRPSVEIDLTYMDFNIEDGILLLIGRITLHWFDNRMAWNPQKSEGQGILQIDLDSNSIWKPTLILNNNLFRGYGFNSDILGRPEHRVISLGAGYMIWRSSIEIPTRCDLSSNRWPWDLQKCSLNFTANTPAMDPCIWPIEEEEEDDKWDIPQVKSLWKITNITKEFHFPYFDVEITFRMKSHSLQIVSCLTFVAVSLVTLPSFLISPINRNKLPSKISSLLLLVFLLAMFANSIPNFTVSAFNFMIGVLVLISIMGTSSCITAYLVRLARKSESYHPSLIMKDPDSEKKEGENDTLNRILSVDVTTDEDFISGESLSKRSQYEWLKIARVIEYSLFAICLIIVIILIINLIT
ncbi:5-hydroxytryptamine receptor 3A-like [Planococcus citri]|uniref:5-hydroxytryptamine receptor 3A-like n=1 Tax=Planococcus citri TaxID=170843 RepID=UPI0031F93E52